MYGRAVGLWLLGCLLVCGLTFAPRGSGPAGARSADAERLEEITNDETLRRTIARAIYGHPSFWREAALPQPPIQIYVQNRHVLLLGTVDGEVERALARSLATGHGETSVTCYLRTRDSSFN